MEPYWKTGDKPTGSIREVYTNRGDCMNHKDCAIRMGGVGCAWVRVHGGRAKQCSRAPLRTRANHKVAVPDALVQGLLACAPAKTQCIHNRCIYSVWVHGAARATLCMHGVVLLSQSTPNTSSEQHVWILIACPYKSASPPQQREPTCHNFGGELTTNGIATTNGIPTRARVSRTRCWPVQRAPTHSCVWRGP